MSFIILDNNILKERGCMFELRDRYRIHIACSGCASFTSTKNWQK